MITPRPRTTSYTLYRVPTQAERIRIAISEYVERLISTALVRKKARTDNEALSFAMLMSGSAERNDEMRVQARNKRMIRSNLLRRRPVPPPPMYRKPQPIPAIAIAMPLTATEAGGKAR